MNPIWQPSPEAELRRVEMTSFYRRKLNARWNKNHRRLRRLHRFSVDEPELFWTAIWDFANIVAKKRSDVVLANRDRMPGAPGSAGRS